MYYKHPRVISLQAVMIHICLCGSGPSVAATSLISFAVITERNGRAYITISTTLLGGLQFSAFSLDICGHTKLTVLNMSMILARGFAFRYTCIQLLVL